MAADAILSGLADVTERLSNLAGRLRTAPGVTAATPGLDVRHVSANIWVDAYVEAELISGNTVVWWTTAHSVGQRWNVASEIRRQTDVGQDLLTGLDSVLVTTGELPHALLHAVEAIAAKAGELDFEAL